MPREHLKTMEEIPVLKAAGRDTHNSLMESRRVLKVCTKPLTGDSDNSPVLVLPERVNTFIGALRDMSRACCSFYDKFFKEVHAECFPRISENDYVAPVLLKKVSSHKGALAVGVVKKDLEILLKQSSTVPIFMKRASKTAGKELFLLIGRLDNTVLLVNKEISKLNKESSEFPLPRHLIVFRHMQEQRDSEKRLRKEARKRWQSQTTAAAAIIEPKRPYPPQGEKPRPIGTAEYPPAPLLSHCPPLPESDLTPEHLEKLGIIRSKASTSSKASSTPKTSSVGVSLPPVPDPFVDGVLPNTALEIWMDTHKIFEDDSTTQPEVPAYSSGAGSPDLDLPSVRKVSTVVPITKYPYPYMTSQEHSSQIHDTTPNWEDHLIAIAPENQFPPLW